MNFLLSEPPTGRVLWALVLSLVCVVLAAAAAIVWLRCNRKPRLTAPEAVAMALSVVCSHRTMHECHRLAPGVLDHLARLGWVLRPGGGR